VVAVSFFHVYSFMVRGKRGNKHTTAIFFSLSSGVMKETLPAK